MMTRTFAIWGLGSSLLVSVPCSAQSPSPLTGGSVSANATKAGEILTFQYTVAVSADGKGEIAFFYLNSTSECQIDGNGHIDDGIVSPQGWLGKPQANAYAAWLRRPGSGINSGEHRQFQLSAKVLPSVCPYLLKQSVDTSALGVPAPEFEGDLPAYLQKVEKLTAALNASGLTLGPTPIPVAFDAGAFVDRLIEQKEKAYALGWIGKAGIKNSLDAKLNAAQAAVMRGQYRPAANILGALLNEVGAQAGKQLSPEAVALLKFNTQYLISKLQ